MIVPKIGIKKLFFEKYGLKSLQCENIQYLENESGLYWLNQDL